MTTHHTHTHRSLAAAALATITALVAGIPTTHAASITWGSATGISADSDVSTNGTLVVAHNFFVADGGNAPDIAAAGPGDVTVNGVTFTGFIVVPNDTVTTVANVSLSAPGPILNGNNLVGSANAPFSNLSNDYQILLQSIVGNPQSGQPVTLTLGGLTIGQTYAFQWWVNASDFGYPDTIRATAGNSVVLDANTTNAPGGTGQFAIGAFIADNANQQILFEGVAGAQSYLNGFQLRQIGQIVPPPVTAVPEPGSALVGMLALGLCGARLGRRRA